MTRKKEDITKRLIPYRDEQDLTKRVAYILNGIYKGFDFKGIGQRLQRRWLKYDCRQAYQHLDPSLKVKLDQIFLPQDEHK